MLARFSMKCLKRDLDVDCLYSGSVVKICLVMRPLWIMRAMLKICITGGFSFDDESYRDIKSLDSVWKEVQKAYFDLIVIKIMTCCDLWFDFASDMKTWVKILVMSKRVRNHSS